MKRATIAATPLINGIVGPRKNRFELVLSGVIDNLSGAGLQFEFEHSEIDSVGARLDDHGFVNAQGMSHDRVTVAANDHADARDLLGKPPVCIQTQVRQEHDEVRPVAPRFSEYLREEFHRVAEGEPRDMIGHGDESGIGSGQTDDREPQVVSFQNDIGLGNRDALTRTILDIGRKKRESGGFGELVQNGPAPVEFVVADGHGIEFQIIHHRDDGLPVEDIGDGSTLEHIARREEQGSVRVSCAFVRNHLCKPRGAADRHSLADTPVDEGQEVPVEIVDVKHRDLAPPAFQRRQGEPSSEAG